MAELKIINGIETIVGTDKQGNQKYFIPKPDIDPATFTGPVRDRYQEVPPDYFKAESRGVLGDVSSGVMRGAVAVPELALTASRSLAERGSSFEKTMRKGAEAITEFKKESPFLQPSKQEILSPVRSAIGGGVEAAVTSAAVRLPSAILGSFMGGPAGTVAGFALGPGAVFGSAEYQRFLDEAEKQGLALTPEMKTEALKSAAVEGGGEAIAGYFGGKLMSPGIFGKVAKTLAPGMGIGTAIKDSGLKSLIKTLGVSSANEISTEMIQNGAEDWLRKGVGIETGITSWEAAKEAFGPTLVMSLLMGGGAAGVSRANMASTTRILDSEKAGTYRTGYRQTAAQIVRERLNKIDPSYAAMWHENATDKIYKGERISLLDTIPVKEVSKLNLKTGKSDKSYVVDLEAARSKFKGAKPTTTKKTDLLKSITEEAPTIKPLPKANKEGKTADEILAERLAAGALPPGTTSAPIPTKPFEPVKTLEEHIQDLDNEVLSKVQPVEVEETTGYTQLNDAFHNSPLSTKQKATMTIKEVKDTLTQWGLSESQISKMAQIEELHGDGISTVLQYLARAEQGGESTNPEVTRLGREILAEGVPTEAIGKVGEKRSVDEIYEDIVADREGEATSTKVEEGPKDDKQTKLHSIANDLADGKEAALEDYKMAISTYGKNTVQDVIGNYLNQTRGLTEGYRKLQPQMRAILDGTDTKVEEVPVSKSTTSKKQASKLAAFEEELEIATPIAEQEPAIKQGTEIGGMGLTEDDLPEDFSKIESLRPENLKDSMDIMLYGARNNPNIENVIEGMAGVIAEDSEGTLTKGNAKAIARKYIEKLKKDNKFPVTKPVGEREVTSADFKSTVKEGKIIEREKAELVKKDAKEAAKVEKGKKKLIKDMAKKEEQKKAAIEKRKAAIAKMEKAATPIEKEPINKDLDVAEAKLRETQKALYEKDKALIKPMTTQGVLKKEKKEKKEHNLKSIIEAAKSVKEKRGAVKELEGLRDEDLIGKSPEELEEAANRMLAESGFTESEALEDMPDGDVELSITKLTSSNIDKLTSWKSLLSKVLDFSSETLLRMSNKFGYSNALQFKYDIETELKDITEEIDARLVSDSFLASREALKAEWAERGDIDSVLDTKKVIDILSMNPDKWTEAERKVAYDFMTPDDFLKQDVNLSVRLKQDSIAFAKWFGKSRIIDPETGAPRVMWHYTPNNFDAFDKYKWNHFGTNEQSQALFDYRSPAQWSNKLEDITGSKFIPVYLSIEKPFRVSDNGANFVFNIYNEIVGYTHERPGVFNTVDSVRMHEIVQRMGNDLYRVADLTSKTPIIEEFSDAIKTMLSHAGFDGLVYSNTGESRLKEPEDSYIPFYPTQIKHTWANNGDYSLGNNSIKASIINQVQKAQARGIASKEMGRALSTLAKKMTGNHVQLVWSDEMPDLINNPKYEKTLVEHGIDRATIQYKGEGVFTFIEEGITKEFVAGAQTVTQLKGKELVQVVTMFGKANKEEAIHEVYHAVRKFMPVEDRSKLDSFFKNNEEDAAKAWTKYAMNKMYGKPVSEKYQSKSLLSQTIKNIFDKMISMAKGVRKLFTNQHSGKVSEPKTINNLFDNIITGRYAEMDIATKYSNARYEKIERTRAAIASRKNIDSVLNDQNNKNRSSIAARLTRDLLLIRHKENDIVIREGVKQVLMQVQRYQQGGSFPTWILDDLISPSRLADIVGDTKNTKGYSFGEYSLEEEAPALSLSKVLSPALMRDWTSDVVGTLKQFTNSLSAKNKINLINEDISAWVPYVSVPWWIAKAQPIFKKVFDLAEAAYEKMEEMPMAILNVSKNPDKFELPHWIADMPKEEKAGLFAHMIASDVLNKDFTIEKNKHLLTDMNALKALIGNRMSKKDLDRLVPMTEAQIEGYKSAKKIFRKTILAYLNTADKILWEAYSDTFTEKNSPGLTEDELEVKNRKYMELLRRITDSKTKLKYRTVRRKVWETNTFDAMLAEGIEESKVRQLFSIFANETRSPEAPDLSKYVGNEFENIIREWAEEYRIPELTKKNPAQERAVENRLKEASFFMDADQLKKFNTDSSEGGSAFESYMKNKMWRRMVHTSQYYVPRNRPDGRYQIKVYKKDEQGKIQEVVYKITDPRFTDGMEAVQLKEFQDELEKEYPASEGYSMKVSRKLRLATSLFTSSSERNLGDYFQTILGKSEKEVMANIAELERQLTLPEDQKLLPDEEVREKIKLLKMGTDEALSIIQEAMREELGKELFSRSRAKSKFMRRESNVIQGYQTEDLDSVALDYVHAMSRHAGRILFMEKAFKQLKRIPPDKKANFYDFTKKYILDTIRPQTKFDMASAKMRMMAFNWFLGLNIKSALVQTTQLLVTSAPFMARHLSRVVGETSLLAAEKRLFKAGRDIAKSIKDDNYLNATSKRALEEVFKRGITKAQFFTQMETQLKGGPAGVMSKMNQVLATPFTKAEEFVRKVSFLAMFETQMEHLNRVNPKEGEEGHKLDEDIYHQAMRDGITFVGDTQYLLGKHNLPGIARGGTVATSLVRTSYTFRGFLHNYASSLVHSLKNPDGSMSIENADVAIRSLVYMSLLGGMAGIPFVDDLLDLLERLLGRPLRAQFSSHFSNDTVRNGIMRGIPAALGTDISGSLKIGLPNPFSLQGIEESLFGVYGSFKQKGDRVTTAAKADDWMQVIEFGSPAFIENALKAYRASMEPLTAVSGAVRYDREGNPLKLTPFEAGRQAIGLRPSKLAEASMMLRVSQNVSEKWRDEREKLYNQAARLKDPEDWKDFWDRVKHYNIAIAQFKGAVSKITPKSVELSLKGRKKQSKMGIYLSQNYSEQSEEEYQDIPPEDVKNWK